MSEGDGLARPRPKRQRTEPASPASRQPSPPSKIDFTLYVRWHGSEGHTMLNRLKLTHIESIDGLQDLPRHLVNKAYERQRLPDYITSEEYQKFTPEVECLPMPGNIVRTELRLVMHHPTDGWEYTVLKRDLGSHEADANRNLLLAVIEFVRRPDDWLGSFGFSMPMIAYPIVSLRKAHMEELQDRLLTDPDNFKGQL